MKFNFFDKLAGSEQFDEFADQGTYGYPQQQMQAATDVAVDEPEGQLPVDVFDAGNAIILRAFVAGVRPDEISVSIARDRVDILGGREDREGSTTQYMLRELFWGNFARTVHLPVEVDVDASTANAKDGLLIITMPKVDKARQTKLRVKVG